jgi:hypothetical protein
MEKQITFYLFSSSGCRMKSITLSMSFFRLVCVGFLTLIMCLAFVIYDYHLLKKSLPEMTALKKEHCLKTEAISKQRVHIQKLAEKLSAVKSKVLALNDVEKTLREIANLEGPFRRDSLLGIGGSDPSALDTRVPGLDQHFTSRPLTKDRKGENHGGKS